MRERDSFPEFVRARNAGEPGDADEGEAPVETTSDRSRGPAPERSETGVPRPKRG